MVPDALSRYEIIKSWIDLESREFKEEEYFIIIKEINGNANSLPDFKVADGIVYKRTRHYNGDLIADDFAGKIWNQ